MELISMTDFVLDTFEEEIDCAISEQRMFNYATFLKQPLTIGMFIPCDDDGNVLQEPKEHFATGNNVLEEAKSKVLFKNCFLDYNIQGDINVLFDNQLIWNTLRTNYSVEDLIPYNLDLAVSF